jgi:hypothetical protein
MNLTNILALFLLAFTLPAFTQEAASTAKTAAAVEYKKPNIEEAAKNMQMRIARVLQLDAETAQKLYQPALDFFKGKEAAIVKLEPSIAAKTGVAKTDDGTVAKLAEKRDAAFKSILGQERFDALQKHIATAKSKKTEAKTYDINPDAILLEN